MYFHTQFLRNIGGTGSPTLGSDADPRTGYGTPGTPPPAYKALTSGADNNLFMRHYSKIAESYKRVGILALSSNGSAATTASGFVWDNLTQHWYLLGAALSNITLTFGSLTSVTVPTFGETAMQAPANQAQSQAMASQPNLRNPGANLQGDPGSLVFMLRVDAGALAAGTYQFAMAPSFADNVT